MDQLTKLVTFLKNWWEAIKSNLFSVRIENIDEFPEFPEMPEVIIPEYPTEIKITNLEEIKPIDKFADIVKAIEKQNKELKPQDKNVVGELKAILKELKKEKKDLTPELIDKVSELIKSVDSKSIDFSALENKIQEIYNLIDSVKEYDEIKVKLNGKQFEKLSKDTAKAIAVGGATGQYDKQILDTTGNVNACGNKLVSTYKDKFRDDFNTFDTTNNWEVMQVGSGQSYQLRGTANGARFLAINSGTTSGAETIIKCRQVFTLPFKLAFGVSVTLSSDTSGAATSGRHANLLPIFEVVECDANGNVIETADAQTYSGTVPNVMSFVYNGTTVTTQTLVMRASGNSESAVATAMGTYSSTLPAGSYPNYIQAGNTVMSCFNDAAYYFSERADNVTQGTLSKKNTSVLDPTKYYTIRIRLKNTGVVVPADFNIHMVRVMDATRVSVDFGLMANGGTDAQNSIPVYSIGGSYVVAETLSTSYGTALSHQLISAATINATLVKTGASLLDSLNLFNRADYTCFLKLYNKATTAPVPSTDLASLVAMIPIPSGEYINVDTGRYADRFTLGLGYAITKGATVIDETAVDAGDILLNLTYV